MQQPLKRWQLADGTRCELSGPAPTEKRSEAPASGPSTLAGKAASLLGKVALGWLAKRASGG